MRRIWTSGELAYPLIGTVFAIAMFGCGLHAAHGDWTNVWSDEFNGSNVDTSKWTYDTGGGGWGNNELEFYTSRTNNAYVTNGTLHIRAKIENTNGNHYTSARLKTQGRFWKTRGWIEFRAKLPQGVGFWPATWMLGTNIASVGWPACGEIDVMENRGTEPAIVGGTIHYNSAGAPSTDIYQTQSYTLPTAGDSVTNFHTYAIQWYTNSIVWLVDNVVVKTWTSWSSSLGSFPAPFDRPFFLIMNLAVGGNYVGNPPQASIDPYMPGEMQVDYVRVYDFISSTNPPPTPTGLTATPIGSQIALTWNPTSSNYKVKRSLVSGGPYTTIATPTLTSYTDTGLVNCTTYYYVVSATNFYGESSNSAEVSATVGSYSLAVNSGGSGTGQFIADANYSGGTPASSANAIATTGLTNPAPQAVYQTERYGTCTYTFGGLTPGSSYTVRLHFAEFYWSSVGQRRFNVSINSSQVLTNFDIIAAAGGKNIATIREFTATANGSGQIIITYTTVTDNAKSSGIEIIQPAPAAPNNLQATSADSQVNLNWSAVAEATGYNVKRAVTSGGPFVIVTNGLTGTAYSDTGLVNGTTYYYVVSTLRILCESTNSVQVSAIPPISFAQWQTMYFGSTNNPAADANADPDGDNQNNQTEFLSGMNPTNGLSVWTIQANPTNGLMPLMVNFTDNSTSTSITNWSWDFGDGAVGSGTNISHTYTNLGTYSVGLTLFNRFGTTTMIASNLITVVQGATINLLAAYLQDQFGNPMTQNGLAVLVADAGTNGFLDPQPSFPLSVGASWGADDRIVGLWNLTASGEDGFLYDQTVALYTAGVAAGQQLQLYWFPSLTLASNTVGVTYYGKYTDTNSPPRDGSAPWNLPAVGANVELVFFIQSVGGSNPDETGLATNLTTVPLSADFTANPTNGLTPLTVAYTDTTTGSPTNWVWNFGDGDSSTLQNPSHTYSTSGVYTVQLIGSGAGSSSTNVKTAFISVSPAALQSWSNLYGVPADSADADGDGMINTNEFLAGFNPTNSDASLAILSLTTQATNVVIRYRASNGDNSYLGGPLSRTNVLEYTLGASGWYSTNFASTGWTNILNGGSGTGAVVDATDTNGATSTPARYYRVRVLLP